MSKDFRMHFDEIELSLSKGESYMWLGVRNTGVSGDWYDFEGLVRHRSVVRLRDFLNEWIGEDDE